MAYFVGRLMQNPLADAVSEVFGSQTDGLRGRPDDVAASFAARLEGMPGDPVGLYVRMELGVLAVMGLAENIVQHVQRVREGYEEY